MNGSFGQGMSRQGIEYEASASLQHVCFGADAEKGPDPAALPAFSGDLDGDVCHGRKGVDGRACRIQIDLV